MPIEHSLHKEVGKKISQSFGSNVAMDVACGKGHRLPLFCDAKKSRATEFCNVDILILKDNKVKVIFEIEEADVKPTQICGKMLTSILSKFYIYGSESYPLDDSLMFIQVVDKSKLKEGKTRKLEQFCYLENAIREILPSKTNRRIEYHLFPMGHNDFEVPMKEIVDTINKFCFVS